MWKSITILAVAASVASAVPAVAGEQSLRWQDCGDGLQCEDVTVPADWARPSGPKITIGLAKLPARDQATRKGVLFFNLGGPGQQISTMRHVKQQLAELTEWFDIITSDPRGFEASTGVNCPIQAPADPVWVFGERTRFEAYKAANREFGERCAVAAGPLAGNLNSWQVARDMDAVRAAVGERELNYYGNSYGTMFAQAYAEFFPNRVGRMYLDSVIDHTRTSIRQWLKPRAETEERGLHRFAEWCAADAGCALHGQEVLQVWDEVMARAERDPIPAPGAGPGVTVDPSTIASRAHTTFPDIWAPLAQALADARNGDATWFTVVGGARDPDLSRIMFCGDFPYPTEYPEVKQLENELRRIAPRIGWRSAWPMANHCAGLPKTGTFPQHPFRTAGLPPILVVNGDHDSTTPPEDGRHLVAQWPGARYLRVPAGHAVYFSGNPCVRGHVHRYLTTGVLPAAGTVCAAD